MSECDINLTDNEIERYSKYQFKMLVKKKIKLKAAEYLTEMQTRHNKSKCLYQSDEMQEYLMTDELSTSEKKLLFKMRSQMCPNKTNFKNS